MEKISLIFSFVLLVSYQGIAQDINWVSFEEAVELQKKNPKKIMMDVYTNWCGPCKMLDKHTFQNKDVVAYVNENYYAVKFNAEGNEEVEYKGETLGNPKYDPAKKNRRNSPHEFTLKLRVSAYPTIVFFDENADIIFPLRGFQKPQGLELYLKLFKNDDHKTMTKQEDFNAYYKAFKPTFTEAQE